MNKNKERNNSRPVDIGASGNICPACRKEILNVSFYTFVPGYLVYLCQDCGNKPIHEQQIIETITANPDTYATQSSDEILVTQRTDLFKPDKDWFDKHPKRRYRIRLMSSSEREKIPGARSMVLHLLEDGDIMGIPLQISPPVPDPDNSEELARLIFTQEMYLQEPGMDPIEAMMKALMDEVNHER